MNVTDAVSTRSSTRAFLSKTISNKLIKELLQKSARSPSGGNLQPWKIFVINGSSMKSFLKFQSLWGLPESPSYEIYPLQLKEPYRTARNELGEQMYETIGITRDDKEGRMKQVMRNFEFFGAPAAIFCFVDKQMGPPQWSDLGMFLQTFMLLAAEAGLATCAQEAWSIKADSVKEFVQADSDEILFCGIALGHKDNNHPINTLKSNRMPLDQWAKFI